MKKRIKGYENYSISTDGVVRNEKFNWELRKENTRNGYERVTLSKDNKTKRFLVHRLVARYFIENPMKKPQVNHINENKTDNRASNLEWVTSSENARHSIKNRESYIKPKVKPKGYKKILNNNTGEIVIGIHNLAEKINLSYSTVKRRLHRNHDWFEWSYIN